MTISRFIAARRSAGPLLLALISGFGDIGLPVREATADPPRRTVWQSQPDARYVAPARTPITVASRPQPIPTPIAPAPQLAPLGLPTIDLQAPSPGPWLAAPAPGTRPVEPPLAPAFEAPAQAEQPAMQLPPPAEFSARPEQVESATARAEAALRDGHRLAERGAAYSAKAEFFKALWLIAQALDDASPDRHVSALRSAVRALEEAEDFQAGPERLDAPIDLSLIISGHRTPVLKSASADALTAQMALDRYLVFAQQKLAEAVDGQRVGSQALYMLGRLHTVVAQDRAPCFVLAEQKALAFQQAAMSVDLNNYLAANELGVLLSRAGRNEEARTILQHCVSLAPRPEVWHNLVVVHRKLGEIGLANQAQQQMTAAQNRHPASAPAAGAKPSDMVKWVEPEEFAKASRPLAQATPPSVNVPPPPASTTSAAANPPVEKQSPGPLGWMSWPGRQSK